MGESYTVNVFFSHEPNAEQKKAYEDAILKGLYDDDQEEEHCEKTSFEVFKENTDAYCEWVDEGKTLLVTFRGWECCYEAARKAARRVKKLE